MNNLPETPDWDAAAAAGFSPPPEYHAIVRETAKNEYIANTFTDQQIAWDAMVRHLVLYGRRQYYSTGFSAMHTPLTTGLLAVRQAFSNHGERLRSQLAAVSVTVLHATHPNILPYKVIHTAQTHSNPKKRGAAYSKAINLLRDLPDLHVSAHILSTEEKDIDPSLVPLPYVESPAAKSPFTFLTLILTIANRQDALI